MISKVLMVLLVMVLVVIFSISSFKSASRKCFSEKVMISVGLMVSLVVVLVISSTVCLVVLASYFSALPIIKKNLVTRQAKISTFTMPTYVLGPQGVY